MEASKLILTPKPDSFNKWILEADFRESTLVGIVNVPKGKVTDLASVPRLFWFILPPMGRYSQASVIHDYLYGTKIFTRKEADKVFYDLMIRYGTYKWKAKLMYYAVRWFGWINY